MEIFKKLLEDQTIKSININQTLQTIRFDDNIIFDFEYGFILKDDTFYNLNTEFLFFARAVYLVGLYRKNQEIIIDYL